MSLFQKAILKNHNQDDTVVFRFVKYEEFKKAKKLKLADKLEECNFKNNWKALFENDKTLTCILKNEIDNMDYEFSGLIDDEIQIVEEE